MGVDMQELASPDSSENQTLDAAEAASTDVVEDSANSSDAHLEGDNDEGLLAVVRDAVNKSKPAEAASPADEDSDDPNTAEASDETQAGEAETESDNESFSDVPFHNHPRFKQLIAQRDQFKGDAEQYQKVQAFLDQNSLNPEEAAEGLTLMALMKHSPQEAWKRLKPRIQQLLVEAGEVLPNDLTERVRRGELTREAALEMSRLRATQDSSKRLREHEDTVRQREQQNQAVMGLRTAAADWETRMRGTDADFDAKLEALQKEVIWLQRRDGVPRDPEGVQRQLQAAYQAVNKTLSASQVRKPEKRPVTGGRVAGTPRAEPKSMLDLVRATRSAG